MFRGGVRIFSPKDPSGPISWATLTLILISSMFQGANAPAYWVPLGVAIIALFAVQATSYVRVGPPKTFERLFGPAVLFGMALFWGLLQTSGLTPGAWAHPVWELVPDATPRVSADPVQGAHIVLRLTSYATAFAIGVAAATTNVARALKLIRAIAIFSAFTAIYGILAMRSDGAFLFEASTGVVTAGFVNRNSYATFACFGVIANLGAYLNFVRNRDADGQDRAQELRSFVESFLAGGWIYAFGVMVCASALLLTASRGGIVAGALAILLFAIVYRRQRGTGTLIWVTLVFLFGALATLLSEPILARVFSTGEEGRFLIYPLVIEGALARPFLGHGLGAFHDTFRQYVPLEAAYGEWEKAHNSYLENIYELGLPAAILFYAALIWVMTVLIRGCLIRRRHRLFASVALGCLVAAGLQSLVDFSLQIPAIALLFSFILGLGWAQSWPSGSQGSPRSSGEPVR